MTSFIMVNVHRAPSLCKCILIFHSNQEGFGPFNFRGNIVMYYIYHDNILVTSDCTHKIYSYSFKQIVSWRIMRRHGNSVPWKLTIFTTEHHQGLRILLTKFEVDMVNLLGVVH